MNLPLLPTTGVGSSSKPKYILDLPRKEKPKGKLDENSKKATREYIKAQEKLGIDILVDGEFYRGDMSTDYARALGFTIADWTRSYGNRFWKKGIVDKPVERKESIQLEPFLYAQSLTSKPIKAILTGPTTLVNWNFDSYYKNREKLLFAWADIIKQEALDLEKAEAKIIQIDEPAIAERFWEVRDGLFAEALKRTIEKLNENTYTITHLCYSDFALVYPYLSSLPVDQVDIELANEFDLGLENSRLLQMMKEDPITNYKDVAIGVIDIRPYSEVENVNTVVKRINTALEILAPTKEALKRIWIKPDCGFRTTKDPEKELAKLEVMTRAVEQVRKEI